MFPLLIPMAAGAVGGALLKKKDPLKGALLGAGLGAGAAAAAPAIGGLLGGSGAASSAAAAAPWADGAGAIVAPVAGPETGLLASTNAALTKYKPVMDAATTGIQMSGALDQQPEQPLPTAPPIMNQGGAEVLAGLASQGGAQQEMQERARRRAMLRGGV